jgi:putative transposase
MLRDHLPGHVAQTAATRAFNAILQYAFGKRGRPKFTRRDRYNSFESKEARSTIIWRDGGIQAAKGVERFRTCERDGLCLSSRHS